MNTYIPLPSASKKPMLPPAYTVTFSVTMFVELNVCHVLPRLGNTVTSDTPGIGGPYVCHQSVHTHMCKYVVCIYVYVLFTTIVIATNTSRDMSTDMCTDGCTDGCTDESHLSI